MVILTTGELMLVPTATTYAANLAPVEMRGRYMSIFALSWQAAAGVGPIFGGFLNDTFSPQAIWLGGGVFGLLATLIVFIGLIFLVDLISAAVRRVLRET